MVLEDSDDPAGVESVESVEAPNSHVRKHPLIRTSSSCVAVTDTGMLLDPGFTEGSHGFN